MELGQGWVAGVWLREQLVGEVRGWGCSAPLSSLAHVMGPCRVGSVDMGRGTQAGDGTCLWPCELVGR